MFNIPSEKISRLAEMTEKSGQIVIVSHSNPDGDALGSSNALRHYLKEISGKTNISVAFPSRWNKSVDFILSEADLSSTFIFETSKDKVESLIDSADLIFCLDMNSFSRAAGMEPILRASKAAKILVDHHLNPEDDCFDLSFSETQISSASELLFHILLKTQQIQEDAKKLPPECTTSILTGLTTDTNNLLHSVFPSTLEAVATMLTTGVDRNAILQHIYNEYSENRFRLMGHILSERMVTKDTGLAYVILDKDTLKRFGVDETELEGFVNLPLGIKHIRMSFLLRETEEGFRVSIRSKIGISANACAMANFHGGGHENAAGGKLYVPHDILSRNDAGAYIENAATPYLND